MKFWKLAVMAMLTFIIIGILLVVIFLLVSQRQKNNSANKTEVKELLNQLSSIIELPAEEPTVATVIDKNKVNNQPFFAHAENGDKLIIFVKSQKAILYRPSEHKIIDFGPINVSNTNNISPTSQPAKKTVTILNGSTINGATLLVQKDIDAFNSLITVTTRDNAKSHAYQKTLVTDVSGGNEELISKLAKALDADIAPISTIEATPKTDILIIAGKNLK